MSITELQERFYLENKFHFSPMIHSWRKSEEKEAEIFSHSLEGLSMVKNFDAIEALFYADRLALEEKIIETASDHSLYVINDWDDNTIKDKILTQEVARIYAGKYLMSQLRYSFKEDFELLQSGVLDLKRPIARIWARDIFYLPFKDHGESLNILCGDYVPYSFHGDEYPVVRQKEIKYIPKGSTEIKIGHEVVLERCGRLEQTCDIAVWLWNTELHDPSTRKGSQKRGSLWQTMLRRKIAV